MALSGIQKTCLALVIIALAWGLDAQDYAITKQQIGSGHESTGGRYTLNGSSGQAVTGLTDGGDYQLSSGYWGKNTDLIFRDDYE